MIVIHYKNGKDVVLPKINCTPKVDIVGALGLQFENKVGRVEGMFNITNPNFLYMHYGSCKDFGCL